MQLQTLELRHGEAQVLIDGRFVDGQILQGTLCERCGWGPLLYTYEGGDSTYCIRCNAYLNKPCGDPQCGFCKQLKTPPLPKLLGEIHVGVTPRDVPGYRSVLRGHPFPRAVRPRIQIVTARKVNRPLFKPVYSFYEQPDEERRELFLLIDGRKVDGWMGTYNARGCCPLCGDQPLLWSDRHRATFCAYCNNWMEPVCQDPECVYCAARTPRPLPSIQQEVFLIDPEVQGVSLDTFAPRKFRKKRLRGGQNARMGTSATREDVE